MDTQNKFISDQLSRYKICQIQDKHLYDLKKVCTSCLNIILNQNFINPVDMQAIFCLFDTLFLQTSRRKENGIYVLRKNIRDYIKNIKLLSFNNVEGYIYLADFFSPHIQAIIKFQKDDSDIPYTIQEYYIGINILNKLRYLIPTFVYTLGAFYCPKTVDANKLPIKNPLSVLCDDTTGKNTAFIVYEKIPGETIKSLLKKGKLNFKQFLGIFIQLLLGLEVAQREARFTHFDLHSDNVMVRENDFDTTYNVHLDMFTYSVINPKFTPVIIDFGASTCYTKNRYIGSYDYIKYGMLNFMVPGHDMYKFLVYCGYEAEPVMKQNIRSLFRFYGDNDPYNIKSDANGLFTSQDEYCKKLTFSQAATYTPLMFVEWLLKEYSLESDIFVYNRINYVPIQYSSLIKEYDKIFKYNKDHGIEYGIELVKKCITSTPSYVMTKYNINLLERYNDDLQSDELNRKIKVLNKYLNKFEDKFLGIDKAMLENVFDIKISTQKDLDLSIIELLTIQIPNPKYIIDETIKLHIEDTVKKLDILLSYEYELSPYLQFYFTILEMKLHNKFFDWIKNFTKSDIYKFYSLNILNTQRAKRWGQSLTAYDNENPIVESPIFQEKKGEIKVLTYNVLHEISKINVCKEDKCLKNICSFIDNNTKDFDFIGIQEYSNIPKMRKYSKELTKMSVTHDEIPEYLKKYGPVTFYNNKKYKLDDSCNTMKFGFSGNLGRGIQINFFNNNLCLINVHAGHDPTKDKINMFDKSLMNYLESAFYDKKCKDIFIKKLQTYKIIMIGDMNDRLDNFTYITIADKKRELYGRTTKPTCCEEKKTMNGKNVEYGAYDHILSTFAKEFFVKVYRPMGFHSDHDPVSSTLTW
jgi:tRNA A-37 threonylcarbamoyl transferase component Bud32